MNLPACMCREQDFAQGPEQRYWLAKMMGFAAGELRARSGRSELARLVRSAQQVLHVYRSFRGPRATPFHGDSHSTGRIDVCLFACAAVPFCVLAVSRGVMELVGLESPWLLSGHTVQSSFVIITIKTCCLPHTRHCRCSLIADHVQSRWARCATHTTKLQRP